MYKGPSMAGKVKSAVNNISSFFPFIDTLFRKKTAFLAPNPQSSSDMVYDVDPRP